MDVNEIAGLIYDYTSGYPFLVSRLCKIIDEKIAGSVSFLDEKAAWTREGGLEAVKTLLLKKNTLFESLMGKLETYPILEKRIYSILFSGKKLLYNLDDFSLDIARMFGFITNANGMVAVANRIFEMRIYNYFLATDDAQNSEIFIYASLLT